jgi:hypothetical protein
MLRAEIVDGVSLLVSGAAKERGTVDDHFNIANRRPERFGVLKVALSELDPFQISCTASLARRTRTLARVGRASPLQPVTMIKLTSSVSSTRSAA